MKILLINQFTEPKNQYGLDRYLHLLNFLNLHGAEAKLVRSSRYPENENDLNNSVESYQQLLKLNNIIEKKFHKNFKSLSQETNTKVKEILKKK